ncbi:MAG: glycosyltransferase [Pseudomonadota bacterium]
MNMDDLDIVVVDNQSNDHSLEIVRSFQDKRIRIIENPMNYGIGYSTYRYFKDCKSKYIIHWCR